MLTALQPIDYPRVRPLLGGLLDYNLILDSVLAGHSPAWVAVDQPASPNGVFLATAEGCFLAGNPDHAPLVADLTAFFHRAMTEDGYWQGGPDLYLNYTPDDWKNHFAAMFAGREPFIVSRHHYVCTALAYDWRAHVPAGYRITRIDQSLFAQPNLTIPDHIPEWMENNWGSLDAFMLRGFGFCTLHENTVVSWSLADCISETRCEIGIQTDPDYRRRGLASLTVAAAVECALSSGLHEVGWHCNVDNAGSIGTALKVGFVKERDYILSCFPLRAK